jgi:hypothetical protein
MQTIQIAAFNLTNQYAITHYNTAVPVNNFIFAIYSLISYLKKIIYEKIKIIAKCKKKRIKKKNVE